MIDIIVLYSDTLIVAELKKRKPFYFAMHLKMLKNPWNKFFKQRILQH